MRREELFYRLWALVSLADREKKTHHGTHLLVEKAVAAHDEGVARPRFLHFEGEDAANRRLEDAVGVRGKGDEIVLPDEVGRSLLHRGKVERTVAERPVWREVRRKDVRLVELVAVLLALRGEASVEVLLRIRRLEDADRVGKTRFIARTRFFAGIGFVRRKWATKPFAWTPASVRDEP